MDVSLCFQVILGLSLPILPNAVTAMVEYGELTAAIPFALSGFEFVLEDTLGRSRTDLSMVMGEMIQAANQAPVFDFQAYTKRKNDVDLLFLFWF